MNNRNQKKVKRKTITLETKIAILNRLADGEGSTALGKEYKLGESTIRAIQKRASNFIFVYCRVCVDDTAFLYMNLKAALTSSASD
uniref:HTH psq-type domain-containing protein n=1 Tax=Glossina palpalis gambiensis TaxID=67801 RepID=A0A1B0C269_9MUSC